MDRLAITSLRAANSNAENRRLIESQLRLYSAPKESCRDAVPHRGLQAGGTPPGYRICQGARSQGNGRGVLATQIQRHLELR